MTKKQDELDEKKSLASTQGMMTDIPDDLQQQIDQTDDGADVDVVKLIKLDGAVVMRMGEIEKDLGDTVDIIILGMMPLGRGCFEGVYDAKNTDTPMCFSMDTKKPHPMSKPPMVIDRDTGFKKEAEKCSGKGGECSGYIGENKCGWKRHIVCVLRSDIGESGLISFPIPSAALFHKGDVKKNDDVDNRVGFESYFKSVKALPTSSGKSPKLFQVVTSLKWHKQLERGETFSFSCIDKHSGAVNATSVEEWAKVIKLMNTDAYKKIMNRYDDYLIDGAQRRLDDSEETATEGASEPSTDNVDDLKAND